MAEKERPLSPKQLRFVEEFLVDLNATQAAIRAGYREKTAAEVGYENLRKPQIAAKIEAAQAKRSERTEITQDMVLQRLWAIATADPNELTQLRRVCCRYCYGKGHNYQWRDRAEFVAACELASRSEENKADGSRYVEMPTDYGGYGFDPKLSPHAKCPKCDGDGLVDVHFADTRKVSPQAALLYAGVKQTQHGLEVKMHDQMGAITLIGRHLGMFKDKVALTNPEGDGPAQIIVQSGVPRPDDYA